jgi:TolA-binding protein
MTNCTGAPAEEMLEQYLQGTLPAQQLKEFEEHFFDCPVCLAKVEVLQAAKLELARHPVLIPTAPQVWSTRNFAYAAIAAVLVIGVVLYYVHGRRQESPPAAIASKAPPAQTGESKTVSPALTQMADLVLPAYVAPNSRGLEDDSKFAAGMAAYASGNCAKAITMLSRVARNDENSLAANFYSGVCQMHNGDLAAASKSLHLVADHGDSPQQEAAIYYLAQIALASNDTASARHYLDLTISLHGDFQRRAQAEIAKLSSPAAGQP